MFSHEEIRLGRLRSKKLRQQTGYLLMSCYVLAFLLGGGGILMFMGTDGLANWAGWGLLIGGLCVGLIGTWCEAISHSVADTYELLEDIHLALRNQHEDKYPDR